MDCLFPFGLCLNCVCSLNGHDREVCNGVVGEEINYSQSSSYPND